jgi:O-antigen/teichoic acid export membrane protein
MPVRFLDRSNLAIIVNAASLLGTSVVGSGLGYLFWLLAARRFSVEEVGLAGGLISAMTLLGHIGQLGFGSLLVTEIPRQRDHPGPLISSATLVASVFSIALGVGFAVLAGHLSDELAVLASDLAAPVMFAGGVAVTAATMVIDQACIGLLRSSLQLARNTGFGILKLAFLALFALLGWSDGAWSIYDAWAVGGLVSVAVPAALLLWQAGGHVDAGALMPRLSTLRGLGRAAGVHHALNLALLGPSLCLPVVVTATLSSSVNAYFYAATMMATMIWAGPAALASMVHAVAIRAPSELGRRLQFSLGVSAIGGVLAIAVVLVAAELLLGFFGDAYASEAGTTLRLLTLAVVPLTVKYHYVAVARVTGPVGRAASVLSVGAVAEVVAGAGGGTLGGLTGVSIAWLAVMAVEAVVVTPAIVRSLRDPDRSP